MVPVRRRKPDLVRGRELETPFAVYRIASAALPGQSDSLLDRLFALECLAVAGPDAAAKRRELVPALRTAESWIEEWESEAVHISVLGQLLSTLVALDQAPRGEWAALLEESLKDALKRDSRWGIATTHATLASVHRGLSAIGATPSSELLKATEDLIDQGGRVQGLAELAESLRLHSVARPLAERASRAVFDDGRAEQPGAGISRWWLNERWRLMHGEDAPGSTGAEIEAARTQALITTPPSDEPRLASMLAEVTARAVDGLVLISSDELELLRASDRRSSLMENLAWRNLVALAALVALGIGLPSILDRFGLNPTTNALKFAFAVPAWMFGVFAMHSVKRAYRLADRQPPEWLSDHLGNVLPIVVAVIAALLYS